MNNTTVVDLSFDSFSNSTNILNSDSGLDIKTSESGDRLLFIDSAVEDYQLLIDNLVESTEVIVLDPQKDGISQISQTLDRYDSLDEIHIVSHGNNGELFLGNTTLDRDSLIDYQEELNSWGDSLEEHGDILLYGCNVATDLTGAEFVKDLSEYTNADIQASNDLTGNSELGGDWDLEYAIGEIEAESIFNDEIQNTYKYKLNQFNIVIPPPSNGSYFNPDIFDRTFTIEGSVPDSSNGFRTPFRSTFIKFINNPNFGDIPLNPENFGDFNIDTGFRLDYLPIGSEIMDSPHNAGRSIIDFPEAENQPFSLNFGEGNFFIFPTRDDRNYDYNRPDVNNLIFNFDASSLNFNPNNFEFTSIENNNNSITFNFEAGTFDYSSLTDRDSLSFELDPGNFDFYDVDPNNTVNFGDNLSFEANSVTFTSNSVNFTYKPESFRFDSSQFEANSHLYEYKLSSEDFEGGVSFEQFNASDYRALDYAFAGDELFDINHYINQGGTPNGMNPFTDYVENGWKQGLDPHPLFDVDYYLNNNIDVRDDGAEPFRHYILTGFTEARPGLDRDPHPLFDTSYYNDNNSDVVNANKNSLAHFVEFGFSENFDNRDPNRYFDSSYYNAQNPDVVAEGVNPLTHYIQFGWRESLENNPGGKNPNRDPNPLFDTEFYFETHTDVRNEILQDFDPSPFRYYSANPVQHVLEFGVEGRFANEIRITHPIFASENQVAFTTFINAQSEGFTFAQNRFSEIGVNLTPLETGEILVAQAGIGEGEGNPIVDFIELAIYTGGLYILSGQIFEDIGTAFEFIAENSQATLSFTVEDLAANPPAFPGEVEAPIIVETFPNGSTIENILNPDGNENIFRLPLEPIDELAENVESFPQKDEILEGLLNEPFIFPDVIEIPQLFYVINDGFGNSIPIGSSSSNGIQEVEDFISTLTPRSTPTSRRANLFEIEQTGTVNYRIPTGKINQQGLPETFDIDGFRGRTIIETKFIGLPARSPFIDGSQVPQFIRDNALRQERDQFRRTADLINNPLIPFTQLEVLVNDVNAIPYFESLLEEFNISGEVKVVPTQVQ